MTGMLKAIHLLQVPMAIMECTPKVYQSNEAQAMFRQFTSETGMKVHQAVLPLHTFWPSRRQRWWATISHPSLGLQDIPEIPPLAFEPKLIHLFPCFMELDDFTLQELKLDDEELEQFMSTPKGMHEHQVNQLKPLPTATHSWAVNLKVVNVVVELMVSVSKESKRRVYMVSSCHFRRHVQSNNP